MREAMSRLKAKIETETPTSISLSVNRESIKLELEEIKEKQQHFSTIIYYLAVDWKFCDKFSIQNIARFKTKITVRKHSLVKKEIVYLFKGVSY